MIQFTVPAIPIAQPRQRHRVIASGGRQFVHNYTPAKAPVNAFKAAVALAAREAWAGAPLDGAIALRVTFVMPRPKSKIRKRGENPRLYHTSRPDIDNLYKSLVDSLSGILWRDDSQLASIQVTKLVADAQEQPGVAVTISELEPLDTHAAQRVG